MRATSVLDFSDINTSPEGEIISHNWPSLAYVKSFTPEVIAVDTETTGLDWSKKHRPFGISLSWYDSSDTRQDAYLEFPVDPFTRMPNYEHSHKYLLEFKHWYTDRRIKKVFANAKYDIHMLEKAFNLFPWGEWHDIIIAGWLCNTLENSYRLNDLAEKYLNVDQSDETELKEKVKKCRSKCKDLNYNAGPKISSIEQDYWLPRVFDSTDRTCQKYALKDSGPRTLDLHYFFQSALQEFNSLEFYEFEMQVTQILYRMESRGLGFDEETCLNTLSQIETQCLDLTEKIQSRFRNPKLNINSSKQLIPYIYGNENGLGCQKIEVTPKGQPSTSSETFRKLLKNTPAGYDPDQKETLQSFLQYRGLDAGRKWFKNFLNYKTEDTTSFSMPHLFSVHPNLNQMASDNTSKKYKGARTGRLSCTNPSLLNVADPEKSDATVDARSVFGPRGGYVWYKIDYSQLELRIFAERLGPQSALYKAFKDGRDPHNETRESVPFLKALPKEEGRKKAKNTNFTIINCGGAGVLYEKYGIPINQGKQILKELHTFEPMIRFRQKEAEKYAIEHGYIKTIFGRRIHVDLSTDPERGYLYAYKATAFDVQGSAADIIKRSILACQKIIGPKNEFHAPKYDAHLLLSIHDELIFEIKKEHSYKGLIKTLKLTMETVAKDVMSLPLECDIKKTTKSWSSKDEVKVNLGV